MSADGVKISLECITEDVVHGLGIDLPRNDRDDAFDWHVSAYCAKIGKVR